MMNNALLVIAALMLAGCFPDTYREMEGNEVFCYLCFGYYSLNGKEQLLIDKDQEAMKEIIKRGIISPIEED